MTTKNFGLDGVASNVLFGKSGLRLAVASGVFKALNTAGTTLVPVQVATPVADEDAATYGILKSTAAAIRTGSGLNSSGNYVANAFTTYLASATSLKGADEALDAALASLQTEVNTSQTGAGLNADGTFTIPTANYLAGATSILDSVVKVDAALKTISNELNTSQTGAGLNANGTYITPSATIYLDGATSLHNATLLLDTAIGNAQAELNTTQASLGLTVAGGLPTLGSTNYLSGQTTLFGAVTTLDAEVKSTNDALAAIGSVFAYQGTLNGGADAGNAFDLDTLSASHGHYYKVAQAGYFIYDGASAFYANVKDGLVLNTADDWDLIDNSDSVVSGTANRIAVTGSADSGFVVNIDSNYVGQASITTLGTITTGTWNGTTIATARGGTGQTAYSSGDLLIGSGSSLTKLARGTAKQILRVNTGGTTLEWADLSSADVAFSNGSFTATNASAALIELKGEIDASQTGAGLNANGSYSANGSANYISGATSLKNADDLLDAALYSLASSMAGLTTDQISSASTYYAVKATDTQTEFYGNVNAAKVLVGSVVSGNSTDTRFKVDMATAGKVQFKAESGTLSNVDLTLVPLGTGAIDASSKRIKNVSNPTTGTDALNLTYAQSTLTSFKTASFSEANAPVSLGLINGLVKRVTIQYGVAFGGASTVTVGTAASQSLLVATADTDPTDTSNFVVDTLTSVNAVVSVYVTGSGSGTGTVVVEYLAA